MEVGKEGERRKTSCMSENATTKVPYIMNPGYAKTRKAKLPNFVYWRARRLLEGILRDHRGKEHENDDGEKKKQRNGTTVKARRARCGKTLALMEMANIAGCSEPRPDCPPIIRR